MYMYKSKMEREENEGNGKAKTSKLIHNFTLHSFVNECFKNHV